LFKGQVFIELCNVSIESATYVPRSGKYSLYGGNLGSRAFKKVKVSSKADNVFEDKEDHSSENKEDKLC
jgi:hypothetical protein